MYVNRSPNKLNKLKEYRKKHKITQANLASHLGISLQFYSQIERGINVLSYKNALSIAEYLNTTTDELFKDDFLKQSAPNSPAL